LHRNNAAKQKLNRQHALETLKMSGGRISHKVFATLAKRANELEDSDDDPQASQLDGNSASNVTKRHHARYRVQNSRHRNIH
jgi:hypothetical protein